MALQLKNYQEKTLETLEAYFEKVAEIGDAKKAFVDTVYERYDEVRNYVEVPGLTGLPYVCLRLPTGGGKTLLACHTTPISNNSLLREPHSVVLWLVPSNAIREQTLNALKNRSHPYRQALESKLGEVTVCEVAEALYVKRATLDGSTTVIVSTLQTFRVDDETGRKVYESAGALQDHFTGLDGETLAALEKREDGTFAYSLANVLRIRRPIVIVDEAHNARTPLSFKTLERFRPSAIIELTATPSLKNDDEQRASNVLHHVSAKELEAEDMIKLPVRLENNANWQVLLAHAIAQLDQLDSEAKAERRKTGEYIRPIMLIKAESRRGTNPITFDVVKEHLMSQCNVPEEQIAVETGSQREATTQDLMAEDCKVRFVITVDALKEGWDCPFAYILCSVAELRAQTAVEQLMGRVLRMPKAVRKQQAALNKAYAFASSSSFQDAAKALEDCLVESGFNRLEASELITRGTASQADLPINRRVPKPRQFKTEETPDVKNLSPDVQEKIEVDEESGTLTFRDTLSAEELEEVRESLVMEGSREQLTKEYEAFESETIELMKYPNERGEKFEVPVLAIQTADQLELFEETMLLDRGWRLANYMDIATIDKWQMAESGSKYAEASLNDEGKIRVEYIRDIENELKLLRSTENWTEAQLVSWLDRTIPHPDVSPDDCILFINKLIDGLLAQAGVELGQLVRDRYALSRRVDALIRQCRKLAKESAYQEVIFDEADGQVLVSGDKAFRFDPDRYPANSICPRSNFFEKHFFEQVGDLKGEGEEFDCAMFIDNLDEVEFWIRNLERSNTSFWLPTSTDRFYPDFVAKLKDGRLLVFEYKGADRWSNDDSREKRRIGELWEFKSGGTCLFAMPKGPDFEAIRNKI